MSQRDIERSVRGWKSPRVRCPKCGTPTNLNKDGSIRVHNLPGSLEGTYEFSKFVAGPRCDHSGKPAALHPATKEGK